MAAEEITPYCIPNKQVDFVPIVPLGMRVMPSTEHAAFLASLNATGQYSYYMCMAPAEEMVLDSIKFAIGHYMKINNPSLKEQRGRVLRIHAFVDEQEQHLKRADLEDRILQQSGLPATFLEFWKHECNVTVDRWDSPDHDNHITMVRYRTNVFILHLDMARDDGYNEMYELYDYPVSGKPLLGRENVCPIVAKAFGLSPLEFEGFLVALKRAVLAIF